MKKKVLGVNRDIFLLGVVSFFTDISSEAIFSIFSVFFTIILGASVALLGVVEGLSDFASSSLDYFAGFLSDRKGKRKIYTILGYAFSTAAKSILLFASIFSAAVFRVIERLGKSFRGPPRDAWIGSLAEKSNRGYSFGFHSAMDKAGAIVGPLMAYLILALLGQSMDTFKLLFIIILIPAALSVVILLFIKDKPSKPVKRESMVSSFKKMNGNFWHYIKAAGIFSLAYFSFSFLMLKAYTIGFAIKDVVLLYVLFNVSFVIASIPLGKLGDIIGRKKIIALEYITYFLMSVGFIFASSKIEIILLFVLFGIFFAIDDGQSKAYITDLEKPRRGTAIGIYNLITGVIYLPASVIAGILWSINSNYAFEFAAIVSLIALIFFVVKRKSLNI